MHVICSGMDELRSLPVLLLLKALQLLSDMQLARLEAPSSALTSHYLGLMLASPSALS